MKTKLITSSANSENIGVTFQGAITIITIMALRSTSIDLSASEITATIEAIFMIAGGLAVVAGTFRKLYIGFGIGK